MKQVRFSTFWKQILSGGLLVFCLVCANSGIYAADGMLPTVIKGLELPPGIELNRPRGTGETTGHIATLAIRNNTDTAFELPSAMFYIPSDGRHQGYVGWPAAGHTVPPGATQDVPVEGYCSSVRLPPVPAGEELPPPEVWIVSTGEVGLVEIPPVNDPVAPGLALFPGTDTPLPRAVSVNDEPMVAVPLLFAAISEIEQATADLQETDGLVTPISSSPERERQAVVQQTFWIFAAELENEPYTKEEFTERLEAQYEDNTGVVIAEAPEEDQNRVQQGADDFWASFEVVGAAAKVLNKPQGRAVPATLDPKRDPNAATAEGQPADKAAPPACTVDHKIEHSPPVVQVRIGENYGDDEAREKIRVGIGESVESEDSAYITSTPPSTAYSIWRQDHIGGISSGYAKAVLMEDHDQEWEWATEPLSTTANGNGVHTLIFKHGPECKAVVAGAAGLWLRASSEAFDPLEGGIEYLGAVDAVKEVAVEYLAGKLGPGLGDGLEAGVEAITDPSSDTSAAASGSATLVVGDNRYSGTAANRVIYKRKDKEDKVIIGGGETVESIKVSGHKPDSLTSRIDANVIIEAGAQGNGFATAYLESLYGTILIGVCECPNAPPIIKVVTHHSQFLRTPAAKEVAERATREMKGAEYAIGHQIGTGTQESDGESLERRAEAELENWVKKVAGDRFESEEEKIASQ